jgi:hypothetical protein
MPSPSPLESRLASALAAISPGIFMACQPQFAFALAADPERGWEGGRKWKADLCWPDVRVLVEVEGIYGGKSRHRTTSGYHEDCNKYNAASLLDYTLLRYTSRHLATDEGAKLAAEEIVGLIRRKMSEKISGEQAQLAGGSVPETEDSSRRSQKWQLTDF